MQKKADQRVLHHNRIDLTISIYLCVSLTLCSIGMTAKNVCLSLWKHALGCKTTLSLIDFYRIVFMIKGCFVKEVLAYFLAPRYYCYPEASVVRLFFSCLTSPKNSKASLLHKYYRYRKNRSFAIISVHSFTQTKSGPKQRIKWKQEVCHLK